ncbi:hypothetical protein [Escherichia coli]
MQVNTAAVSLSVSTISGDNIINAAEAGSALTLIGTGTNFAAGTVVTVLLNGKGYSATIQNNGSWSVNVPAADVAALADGTSYTVSASAQAFIGELDGGVFETKIGAVLSEVASGVMNTKTKGKVSLNLEIEPFDESRVKIKHKLSYVRPTNRGKISEEDTTETPMYVNRGGRLTILQEDQGQLLTLAGEPDGKLRAAGH